MVSGHRSGYSARSRVIILAASAVAALVSQEVVKVLAGYELSVVSSDKASWRSGGGIPSTSQFPPSSTTSGLIGQCEDQLAVREEGDKSPNWANG